VHKDGDQNKRNTQAAPYLTLPLSLGNLLIQSIPSHHHTATMMTHKVLSLGNLLIQSIPSHHHTATMMTHNEIL